MLHMTQSDRSRAIAPDEIILDHDAPESIGDSIIYALGFARQQSLLILFVAALGVAASVIYLSATPPTYTGRAKILFANPKSEFFQQQSIVADNPVDRAQFESQLQILQSKAIAVSVINQLKLSDDPDFSESTQPLRKFYEGFLSLFGSERVAKHESKPIEEPDDGLIAAFEERLGAERIGLSSVIEITFNSSDPQRAAQIANGVADAYIADQLNAKFEANRRATTWLQVRLRELGQQALTAERAVSAFKLQNNIVAAGGKLMDDQQVAELNSRLVAARAQTADARAKMDMFSTTVQQNEAAADSSNASLDATVSDTLNSPIINTLRQQYLELERRESDWAARFGQNHLAVVNLRTRMRDIRKSIIGEVRRLAETSKSDYEVAKQRQEEIEKQLAQAVSQSRTTNSAESTMRELETSAKGYRTLYESFLQRYMGAVQQESFPITEARVISPASPPQSKSKPKTPLILALGLFGGLALGTALGFLRDIMDRVFRTAAQVEATLHLPCISLIPLLKDKEPKQLTREDQSALEHQQADGQRTIVRRSGVFWAATEMPLSRFAESIRSIKLAIDLNPTNTSTSNKVVGITSSLPNEGKSTIAAALAQLLAHTGARVIVVDCDLRNPSLSQSLAPAASAGIIEVASGKCSLEEAIWRDPTTDLALLPAVKQQPIFHASEILSAAPTKKLFDSLRTTYDYVIVDLPPLAPIVDVRLTAPLIDCFILAIEWGVTKTDVVQHALHTAPNLHETLIGAVLNKTDMEAIRRYDQYHNDYYSNKHYARYGYTS